MRWSRYLLYPAVLPVDLFCWAFVALLAWRLGKSEWSDGSLLATVRRKSWLGRWFPNTGGATLFHNIVIYDDQDVAQILKHERVHVQQLEMSGLASGFLAGFAFYQAPWAGVVIWLFGPILFYLCGGLVALCYGQHVYRDNPNEAAAYDHVDASRS